MVLILGCAWLLILKNKIWKRWLLAQYGGTSATVAGELGLHLQDDFWARLSYRGRDGATRLQVKWLVGMGPHRVKIVARRGFRRRSWVGRPDTPPDALVQTARRLVAEAGR